VQYVSEYVQCQMECSLDYPRKRERERESDGVWRHDSLIHPTPTHLSSMPLWTLYEEIELNRMNRN
jgi:hypothetical protein